MIHRGEIVERVVRDSGIPLTKVAKKMGKSRRWIYNVFEMPDLSLDLVLEFGKILHYDFSDEIPQIANRTSIINDRDIPYGVNKVEYWKNKYYRLLEEYNELLKKDSKDK
ncbi:hypothetical protein [Fluviicola sp.]|uniref:hypothetical protein n=1 Tax=Fluviicola sp. TaxID=1917219 RepID=UPI0031D53773